MSAHLCHSGVLWAEDGLPLAAALQMKRGAQLYRQIWFDKPPLVPAIYLLWGAKAGWALRLAGGVYAFLCSVLAFLLGRDLWTLREGFWAAGAMAFFLTFDTPSAVLPLAADMLMLAPHLAAVWLAVRQRPVLSGIAAGLAFLCNAKGAIVLAACALFAWPSILPLIAGFALPNLIALGWLGATGAFRFFVEQVWLWMSQYAGDTFLAHPVANGLLRTLNWMGFHGALVLGAAVYFGQRDDNPRRKWQMGTWLALALCGVVLGFRFFPRYYFILLPALSVAAARGGATLPVSSAPSSRLKARWIGCALLAAAIVPVVRFGPKYVTLALGREEAWSDLAMDRDSRAASNLLRGMEGKTLYVWGYRPEIFAYTKMLPATKYLECQALTGVPADRHLGQTHVVLTSGTREARAEVIAARPDVVIDGLGPYNPALALTRYPDMARMLEGYHQTGRTNGTILYLRNSSYPPTAIP